LLFLLLLFSVNLPYADSLLSTSQISCTFSVAFVVQKKSAQARGCV
jgi:hypothetical protein